MSDEQNALSMLAGFNSAYAEANANNGEGGLGEWPPEGKHACTITDIVLTPLTGPKARKYKDKTQGGREYQFDGVNVQFFYRCNDKVPGQKNPDEPLSWKGSPMFLPAQPNLVPEGLSWVKTMAAERLKGHLAVINGNTGSNLQADLAAAKTKVSGASVSVMVNCRYSEGKQTAEQKASGKAAYINKDEYLTELLSG